MAIYDGWQGRRRGEHNPNRFTRVGVQDNPNPSRRNASPIVTTSSDVRNRTVPDTEPAPKEYRVGGCVLSQEEWDERQRNIKAREERQKKAVEDKQAADLRERQRVARLQWKQESDAAALETSFTQHEIAAVLSQHNVTDTERRTIEARLRAQGEAVINCPTLWELELEQLRSK